MPLPPLRVRAALVLTLIIPFLFGARGTPARAETPAATRPAAARGTTLVPDDFLRRWDPVTIFFPRDVGPADSGPEDNPGRLVTLTPAHPGAFTWLDARTLQFKPAEPWPPLARFTWQVGRTTVRLATLMSPPRKTEPADGREGLDAVDAVALTFAEPLTAADLARAVTLELRPLPGVGSEGARWLNDEDFEIKVMERASRSAEATYVLALHQPIALGTRAIVHFRLSLDDASVSFSQVSFATAEPFRAVAFGCRANRYPVTPEGSRYTPDQAIRCNADDRSLVVDFSAAPHELGPIEGRTLVRLTPSVANLRYEVAGKRLVVRGDFARESEYRVTLKPAAIADRQGRPLDLRGENELYLFFPAQPPYLGWTASHGVVERRGPQMVPVKGRGQERMDLRIQRVDPLDLAFWPFPEQPVVIDEAERPPGPGEEPPPRTSLDNLINTSQLKKQIAALGSPPISILEPLPLRREGGAASFGLDLEPHLDTISGAGVPGTYLVGLRRLDGSTERSWMRVQVTDLSLTTIEEPQRVIFVVTSPRSGRPVAGAEVRIEGSGSGPVLFSGTTDARGELVWNVPNEHSSRTVRRIVATKDGDTLVLDPRRPPDGYADNHWSESRETWLQWTQNYIAHRLPQTERLAHLFTERPVYRPEEPVHIKGYLRERFQGKLTPITWEGHLVVDGPGDLEWRYPLEPTDAGSVYHLFDEEKLPTGIYRAYLE
ncbi:MAG: alpha-2-macroglobulin, partial [bacterium]|nr:alpha-2-macroglobulin [bacterium]